MNAQLNHSYNVSSQFIFSFRFERLNDILFCFVTFFSFFVLQGALHRKNSLKCQETKKIQGKKNSQQ